MGKRTTSSSRSKSSKSSKGGKGKGKGKGKGTTKSSALEYASKLEQLAQDRKKMEKDVRKDIDTISEDIGQLVAHEIEVGKAPEHLEKARKAADKKDHKTASGHLKRAQSSLNKTALPKVEERINQAQDRINAVERLGVEEEGLGEQLGDARKQLKKKMLLPALETAESAAKRAMELAQNQLTEVVGILEMVIKDDMEQGLDVSRAQEFLDNAKAAVDDQDYEAAVEHTLQAQTSLDRARKGLTTDADEDTVVSDGLIEEEDRDFVEDIIRRGLEQMEEDLGILEEIRGLVTHPENLITKARKALDDGNLAQARKLLRDAHLATVRAMRERLQDVLNAANERMRKAKREGLSLQEIRPLYLTALKSMDTYKWKEAYDTALSIEDRITKVKADKEEIQNDLQEAEDEIASLAELGTNEARVNELMEQARTNLDRGDFKKARLNIAKAQSTARTSTQNFINNYIIEVRNVLLSVRTIGGNIATARPMLITAKKEMNKKDYLKAVDLVNDSINTIKGVDQEYLETLQELMKSKYNYTLADSLGLNVADVKENLDQAFGELKAKEYDKAIKLAQKTDFEVEIITEDYKTTSEDLAKAKESILEGKKVGADITEADFLLSKAITQIEKNSFEVAQELLTDANDAAEKARNERVGALLSQSKEVVEEEQKKGVQADDSESLLSEAEKSYKRADYTATIDLINEAIGVMSVSTRRMESAEEELTAAEDLFKENDKYAEANPLAEDYISTSRNLLAGGQYPEAYDAARVACLDLESSLVRYIDLIMEDTKTEISKAEEAGATVPVARDSYKLARRYLDKNDAATALTLARKSRETAREMLDQYNEVNENLDLLDSYIQWGKRVSRHLDMPVTELEEANSLVKDKKYAEANTVVKTALESARESQVGFVNDDLESVDVYLKELESGGVGTSVARNTLNQAHNSLDDLNFEQAYTLASQAREQGEKNQELYKDIISKLRKGKDGIAWTEGLGVDTSSLKEFVDKTEKALVNQTYTFALDFVDQLIAELPKVTQVYINKRFNEANTLLEESRDLGLVVDEQEALMAKAMGVAADGNLEVTVETIDRLEEEVNSLRERYDEAKGSLDHLAEVLEAADEIGVEIEGPRRLEGDAAKALVENDFKAVHRIVSEAEDELIRTSSSFIVDYINRVQETILRLDRQGAWVTKIEDQVDVAWTHLDDRRFTEAFSTARECTLTLQKVEERFEGIHDNFRSAEANVHRMGFLEVDTGDAVAVMSKAHEALVDLDLDRAEKHISDALDELATALKETVENQMKDLEALLETTKSEGADISSASERLDRARSLAEVTKYQAAYMMVLEGIEAVDRARREMEDAVEGRRKAEELFHDAEELGADVSRSKELLAEIDDDLSDRRYREGLLAVNRLTLEIYKAKREHVMGLLTEGQNAIIEAEELGLSVKVLRNELDQAEEQLDLRDFHAAVATTTEATQAAKDLMEQFVTARDRIVDVQSFIYDASGIGTDTGRATDMLGEARDALAEQRLDEALDLAERSETEVKERQKEMASYELEALTDLRDEASEQGMVIGTLQGAIDQAEEMTGTEDHKGAILRLREGIEEGRELLVKYQKATESIGRADDLLAIMVELEIDSGVPGAELEKAKRLVPEEDYEQAKTTAVDVSETITRILDEYVADRVNDLRGAFTRAEEVGIQVDDLETSFNSEYGDQDLTEYLALAAVINTHEAQVKERTAAYDDASSRIEEAQTLFNDAVELQVDVSTATPVLEDARTTLSAGMYPEAAAKADTAREKVLDLQKQFVLKYIGDAEALISELQSMGVDTIQSNEFLDQAKAALDLEEYPPAHASAVEAITESQRVKELFNEAQDLIEEARKTIDRAKDLGVDPAPAVELLEQAVDSLEFQSYEEAIGHATESRQVAGRLMKEHVEEALDTLKDRADDIVAKGIEFEKGMSLVAMASTHLEESRYIEVQDTVDVAMDHLNQRIALHELTERIHKMVFEELENAETLGVDVEIYESDTQRFRQLYEERDYRQAIPWGKSMLERLGNDQRRMMDMYMGEVTDVFDSFIDIEGTPKAPQELLDKSMAYYYDNEFIQSYKFIQRARESIETEWRSLEESHSVLNNTKNIVAWAEGMGVPVDDCRVELDRGLQLMDSYEYSAALLALNESFDKAVESISESATKTLKKAEKRAKEVHDKGANAGMITDRVNRGRRSFEEEDFGFALTFGHLALSAARRAEEEAEEAKKEIKTVEHQLDLARKILADPSEVEALHSNVVTSMKERHIRDAIKQSKLAQASITTKMRGAVQDHIERVGDDIRLMGLMDLETEALSERLGEARNKMEEGNYVEAAEIVEDVRAPVLSHMEDRARITLEEAKEAVDIMDTVGAEDAEVVSNLNQTQDMFAANDYYHSHELSARVTVRAQEVSDHEIAAIISDIRELMEEADRLGVETGELNRRVDSAERHREQAEFIESKNALDELTKDVDEAQRELVEGLIKTCDELAIIANERELDAQAAPEHLAEAHHHLSLKSYKKSLEAAKESFNVFEEIFTQVVRNTLQDAKDLLVNLDVSADIETSSEHYIEAEDALSRQDYVAAMANADAAMANARVIQVQIIEEILTETDLENTRGEGMGTDMESSLELTSRAREALADGDLEEAQTLALNARRESRSLQQVFASQLLQAAKAAVAAVPFDVDLDDIQELLQSATGNLEEGEFETCADEAKQARSILDDRLESEVGSYIVKAEEDIERGKEVGIDLTGPKEHLKDAKAHLDDLKYLEGQEEARKCSELVADLIDKHEQAQGALSNLMELIERATRARAKLSESMDMQEAAEDAMDEHDYDRVMELAALAVEDANRSYEARVREAITDAESTLNTLERMGASAKLAEDLLGMARDAVDLDDLDGAYDYADQSIKEADTAKTSYSKIVDITFKAESLIGTAKGFGMDVSEAQSKFEEALETREEDVNRALALAEEARAIATQLVDSFFPELDVAMELESALVLDKWTNANLMVRNDGSARALRTKIEMTGNLDVDGLGEINILRGKGKVKKLPIRIKPLKSGEIMVRVWISCEREYDDKPFEFHDVRWLLADEEEPEGEEDEEAGAQFLRKELTCTICQGKIGTQESPRACSCGATFHHECADQLTECPNCSKSLGGAD
jgi:tetratricopeptide (TPR) repeat protein